MSKFNPRTDTPLWLENSGLSTDEIQEAVAPAMAFLEAAGVTPEEAHAEYLALIEAGDQDAIYASTWHQAELEINVEGMEAGAVMALA